MAISNFVAAERKLSLGTAKKKKKADTLNFFDFDAIRVSLASPDQIHNWSYGEVKKPETINYRTLKPERDGLFCERIYGPVRDYECACGKYRWIKFKGIICDRCGVEVTEAKVRRERMGHIQLAVPVAHIWFLKKTPSRIGIILNMRTTDLERVVYYASYVVLDDLVDANGTKVYSALDLLSEDEVRKAKEKFGGKLKVGIGAGAVHSLLSKVEPKKEVAEMKTRIQEAASEGERSRLIRRLRILQGFADSGNRPEWMILTELPVIPPELRPLVPLEGGRFATSDLNDLYRRIINRNNRLKHIEALRAPEVMIYNEKRLLQEAVDALIENGARGKVVIGAGNRPLKSLSDILKGKQGRFRQNLLGKRVDYSGRSVIVVGPSLRIHQCGLPKEMALELFKPFIIRELMKKDSLTLKAAKRMFERVRPEIWDILEQVTRKHPVLLNRAPTLHRLGIQAFEPVLVEGKAIQLHPLTCTAFNADFDGDQMAVHIPLSQEAQLEARLLMMSTNNILSPASGRPIMTPTHDMVLGVHYLTKVKPHERGEGMVFSDSVEAVAAQQMGKVDLHAKVRVRGLSRILAPEPLLEEIREALRQLGIVKRAPPVEPKDIADYKQRMGLPEKEVLDVLRVLGIPEKEALGLAASVPAKDTARLSMVLSNYYTTLGRVLFNEVIPKDLSAFYLETSVLAASKETAAAAKGAAGPFMAVGQIPDEHVGACLKAWLARVVALGFETNGVMGKKELSRLVEQCYKKLGHYRTVVLLDDLKRLGFHYATRAGLSISIADMKIPGIKKELVSRARHEVREIERQAKMGVITESERYNKVIAIWTEVTDKLSERIMKEEFTQDDSAPYSTDKPRFNSIFLMATSGARGSTQQVRQLAGMRGLMAKPQSKITGGAGEIIESPITSNLREGMTVLEYFISTHGGRKGLADTALKTADAGYLTRRLVDSAHDLVITEEDCGTLNGVRLTALTAGDDVIESLEERILGRVVLDDVAVVIASADGKSVEEIAVPAGEMVTAEMAEKVRLGGVKLVRVRSVLTCETRYGVCARCYGMNLATGRLVEIGEAVGIVAAQSIGEPGTQLTLRTFHIGGAAAVVSKRPKAVAGAAGKVVYRGIQTLKNRSGETLCVSRNGSIAIQDSRSKAEREVYKIIYGARLKVPDGGVVAAGDVLAEWDPYALPIIAEQEGEVSLADVKEGVTLHEERNKITGIIERKIIEHRGERSGSGRMNPRVIVEKGGREHHYALPIDTTVMVEGGQKVHPGDILAKIPQEVTKTKDITGGLPRVSELFEARKPKSSAVISEIAGVVSLSTTAKGLTQVTVRDEETGMFKEYVIPHGKHLVVYTGDRVGVGEPLSDGAINPHDILRVKGVKEVQEYLVNAIQEVYRLQGVQVSDRHIESIVRQMLKNVKIVDSGDTPFLRGQDVDRFVFDEVNRDIASKGGREAQAEPVLMGISKASLASESFVSAASFQETTRVLTEAATTSQIDTLRGLKENVIIGHIIPAGTGLYARQSPSARPPAAPPEA